MGKILIISILSSIINFLIYFNQDIGIGYIVPILGVLVSFLYLTAILKIPTFWSFIITVTGGIIAPMVIQLVIVYGSFGYFLPTELQEHINRNYILDITSGVIFTIIAAVLYVQGWSFKFDFDTIRFKWERYVVMTIAALAAISLPITIVWTRLSHITLSLAFLSISSFLIFFILFGYALKKEKDENRFLKPVKEVREHV